MKLHLLSVFLLWTATSVEGVLKGTAVKEANEVNPSWSDTRSLTQAYDCHGQCKKEKKANRRKGVAAKDKGDDKEAAKFFKEATKLFKSCIADCPSLPCLKACNEEKRSGRSAGMAMQEQGDDKEAEKLFKKAIETFKICAVLCDTEAELDVPNSPPRTLDEFGGIEQAYSVDKGQINVAWDTNLIVDDSADDVIYDVFVALGTFNYSDYETPEEMIDIFQATPDFQHHQVTGIDELLINTTFYGQLHSVLVTASINNETSPLREPKDIIVSANDPVINPGVILKGFFIPTIRVQITLTGSDTIDPSNETDLAIQTLSFKGLVHPIALKLEVGDIVTGITSDLNTFSTEILDIIKSEEDQVILTVLQSKLEDVFATLDVDLSFDASNVPGNSTEVSEFRRRRLLFGFVKKAFSKATKFVADKVVGVVDNAKKAVSFVAQAAKALVGGLTSKQFGPIDLNKTFKKDIPVPNDIGAEVSALFIELSIGLKITISASVRVFGALPKYAKLGAKLDYKAGVAIGAEGSLAKEFTKVLPLFDGPRVSSGVILIGGVVPFEIYAKPKVSTEFKATFSLQARMETGVSASGSTEVAVVYDEGKFGPSLVGPTFKPQLDLPTIGGTASAGASASLIISLETGLYGGILAAGIGLRGTLGADVAASLLVSYDGPNVFYWDQFALGFTLGVPFFGTALYGKFKLFETNIYEKKFPLVALPEVKIGVLEKHACILGDGMNASVARMVLNVSTETESLIIPNGISGNATWRLDDADNGWKIASSSNEMATFEKTGLTLTSPQPLGTVTYYVRPKFPPLPFYIKNKEEVTLQGLSPAEELTCTVLATCGNGNVGNGVCPIAGNCCSWRGYCGHAMFCAEGGYLGTGSNTGGTCSVGPDGKAGNIGKIGNGVCNTVGECCSIAGYCGVTSEWCDTGPGTCGGGNRGDLRCPRAGECCNKDGYCGTSDADCIGSVVGTCGFGNPGNGICPIEGNCCVNGWCAGSTKCYAGSDIGKCCNDSGCSFDESYCNYQSTTHCLNGNRGTGNCLRVGECCNAAGYCGTTEKDCAEDYEFLYGG